MLVKSEVCCLFGNRLLQSARQIMIVAEKMSGNEVIYAGESPTHTPHRIRQEWNRHLQELEHLNLGEHLDPENRGGRPCVVARTK